MDTATQPLIQLEDVQKVFYTEEVETHALSTINLEIGRGEFVSVAGPYDGAITEENMMARELEGVA